MDTQQDYIDGVNKSLQQTEGKIKSFAEMRNSFTNVFNILAPIFAILSFIGFNWVFFIIQVLVLCSLALFSHLSRKREKEQIELWELETWFKSMTIKEMMGGEINLPDLSD